MLKRLQTSGSCEPDIFNRKKLGALLSSFNFSTMYSAIAPKKKPKRKQQKKKKTALHAAITFSCQF